MNPLKLQTIFKSIFLYSSLEEDTFLKAVSTSGNDRHLFFVPITINNRHSVVQE